MNEKTGNEKTGAGKAFSAPWMIFWVAFAVRLAYVMLAHTYRVRPYDDHFGFGWEMGRIARALVDEAHRIYPYSKAIRGNIESRSIWSELHLAMVLR